MSLKKDEIRKKDRESGTLYLRDGVTLAFFLPMPFDRVTGAVLKVFEEYLRMIPSDAFKWASVGATSEEWRPIAKTTIDRCRAQLTPEAARKRQLTAFELADGDSAGDAPGYGFKVVGNPYDPDLPDEANLVQMYFPTEVIEASRVELFVENARRLAAFLPYISGYGSPGLHWSELYATEAFTQARALVKRHHGYDVQHNEVGRSDIDSKVRGARWLTFLGPEIVEQLDGLKALQNALSESIAVEQVGHGVMIRACECPEVGDVNRRVETPLLRALARVLEPVTLFGEPALFETSFAVDDEDFLIQWERRFLD